MATTVLLRSNSTRLINIVQEGAGRNVMTYGIAKEDHEVQTSPQIYARTGGVLYLIIIVGGIVGHAFIRDRLIVPGDATATAANIRSLESLWRFGIAAELFMLICTVALALILFVLLRA